jgi:hypothetical protein
MRGRAPHMRLPLWSQWPTPGVLQMAALRLSFARGQHLNRAALAADWVSTEYGRRAASLHGVAYDHTSDSGSDSKARPSHSSEGALTPFAASWLTGLLGECRIRADME